MAYATLSQIQTAAGGPVRLIELADFDADGAVDDAVVAQAQAEVDARIDSYVAKRYAVPLPAPSVALQACSAAEVVYRLHEQRGNVQTDSPMHRSHLERTAWLEAIAKGHVVPTDPLPTLASTARSAWVGPDDDDPTSTSNLEGGW